MWQFRVAATISTAILRESAVCLSRERDGVRFPQSSVPFIDMWRVGAQHQMESFSEPECHQNDVYEFDC
jgi:hypothetical protein